MIAFPRVATARASFAEDSLNFIWSGMYSLPQIKLSTERLSMRPIQDDDASALFAVFSDPRIMRYGSTPAWDSIDMAIDKIARNQRGMATGDSICLAIFSKQDHQLLGTADLFQLDSQCRRGEIGYALAFDAWGKGHMCEALTVLLEYGFSELKLNRIEADIDPRNTASVKSLTRLGFKHEGLLRERWIVGGEVSDSAIYGLLSGEWLGRQPIPLSSQ